jgi:trehalose 6-phosphate synthase
MLDSGEVDPEHIALIQVVRPDPAHSPMAHDLRMRIEHRVGLINGRHGRVGRPALQYLHRAPDRSELVALYCAADVLWATPLHAETSLVTKEYLATRSDNSGTVILSEFCGAVDELANADAANPYDTDDVRRIVLRALQDTSPARRDRMATMRRHVHTHDIHHWAGDVLSALGQNAIIRSATALDTTAARR